LILRNSQLIQDIHSSISLMCSACLVRTRFILNNFSGIGLGVPGVPGLSLATPLEYRKLV